MARTAIYHERQSLLHCGRHALNNLIGEEKPWATHQMLQNIAEVLRIRHEQEVGSTTWLNPYHHWAGAWLGHWDVMVLIEALKTKSLKVCEHIVVNSISFEKFQGKLLEVDNNEIIIGVIVNESSNSWLMQKISGSHWYSLSLRKHENELKWFNCDSKLSEPVLLFPLKTSHCDQSTGGSYQDLIKYLYQRAGRATTQCFVISKESMNGETVHNM